MYELSLVLGGVAAMAVIHEGLWWLLVKLGLATDYDPTE